MMKRVAAAGLVMTLPIALQAAGAASQKGVSMPPVQIVAVRRAAMMMSGATLGTLRAQANAEDLKRAAFPARGLAEWAKAIPSMFPAGTDVPPTEALPALWSDRAGFAASAQMFGDATASLAQAAAANDKAAYAAALERVGKGCSGCHDKYRKEQQRP